MADTYRIIEFSAENFKRLRMVGFQPKGRVTMLTGKNDQGKSSVLDAVAYAFGGKKAAPEMPMRRGAKTMEIVLNLGKLIVRRTGTRLEVTPAKGEKAWNTPQAMLDSIYDELAFNPQEFALMDAEDQAEALRKLTGIDAELKRLDKANADDYAARTPINAEVKRLQAEIASILVQDGLPKEKVDEEAIKARKREANEANRNALARTVEKQRLAGALADAEMGEQRHMQLIRETAAKLQEARNQHPELMEKLKKAKHIGAALTPLIVTAREIAAPALLYTLLQAEQQTHDYCATENAKGANLVDFITDKQKVLTAAEHTEQSVHDAVAEARMAWENAPSGEMADTASLDEELERAQLVNREIDKRTRQAGLIELRRGKQAEADQLTRAMEDREEEKRKAIADAQMPLEGLTVTEKQVLLNGIPVKQLGEARQILLGVAIGIARNPALRLVLIPHGEALDEDTLAELGKMAEEKDFYVWMAKVDSTGKVGIYLEDGMIKENNEE
jgi:hypothetical protein